MEYWWNNKKAFGRIQYFFKITSCSCSSDMCSCNGNHFAVINPIEVSVQFVTGELEREIEMPHIFKCNLTNSIIIIPVLDLITPCIVIDSTNSMYISKPANSVENE